MALVATEPLGVFGITLLAPNIAVNQHEPRAREVYLGVSEPVNVADQRATDYLLDVLLHLGELHTSIVVHGFVSAWAPASGSPLCPPRLTDLYFTSLDTYYVITGSWGTGRGIPGRQYGTDLLDGSSLER